jgi:carboxyl-terminal processing protease
MAILRTESMRQHALAVFLAVLLIGAAPRAADLPVQSTRLAALAKVWGLLKYFHPGVAQGSIDWDAALVDEIPRIELTLAKDDFNEELLRFIRSAGSPPAVPPTAVLTEPEADAAFGWLDDAQLFNLATIDALKTIRHGYPPSTNRYVQQTSPSVQNPSFSAEQPYFGPIYPTREMRLLALFRYWNMVQYYYPNRDLIDRPWGDVLVDMIPRFSSAADDLAHGLATCELTASITDTHAETVSETIAAHWGLNMAPIQIRHIEAQTVVTRVLDRLSLGADIRPGDVITDIDGVAADDKRATLRPYVSGSNDASLERGIDELVVRTPAQSIALGVLRFGVRKTVTLTTYPLQTVLTEETSLDAQQPKWRVLDGNIGYVNMGLLQMSDVDAMMMALATTPAIVFDVRNNPNGTLYLIARHLNPGPALFVRFTQPDYQNPGSFSWTGARYVAGPPSQTNNFYRGKVILLGDERTQSQAEFTMMALRTAPDVTVVGSQTAGADGNISMIQLPGGILTYFSGLGVFYPNGTNTQRVGIVPDVFVVPTIEGIQNGVDEVLDRALALVR